MARGIADSGPRAVKTPSEALAEVVDSKTFQLLVDAVADYAIYMLDVNGRVVNWNTGAQRIKGYTPDEIVGRHFSQFYTEEDRAADEPQRALRTAATEGRYERESWRLRKDGTRFWANVVLDAIRDEKGNLIGYAKITRDITERRNAQLELEKTQAALFQSQKMQALGQLTAGVAHDFNNLLTVIMNNLYLLQRKPADAARVSRLLESAQQASERAARLTQQLLAFSRRQPLRPATHNPTGLLSSMIAVLRRACGDSIDVRLDLDTAPRLARIDAPQFEVAILNLVVNARDAMPNGGALRLTTRDVQIDARNAAIMSDIRAGPYILISIQDTGEGMSPEVRARAFEPFFTTKEVGKGSGLGLSQVYGFVTQSGGHVDINSEVGVGTTIRLYLPAIEGVEARTEVPEQEELSDGSGTVLLVEDDGDVLATAVEALEGLGYEVITAVDAGEALALLESTSKIDILFTDVMMPGAINGVDLARRARELRPELGILLGSGYATAALAQTQGVEDEFAFIRKPYHWAEISQRLRRLRSSSKPAEK